MSLLQVGKQAQVQTGTYTFSAYMTNTNNSLTGGAFIDCYPSQKHKEVLHKMTKTNNVMRRFKNQSRENENVLILKFLESAKSSYDRKDLKRKYECNRLM
jgi:hypothetical protein